MNQKGFLVSLVFLMFLSTFNLQSSPYNLLISIADGAGIEFEFHPDFTLGGLILTPFAHFLYGQKNNFLISTNDLSISGYRIYEDNKYKHPDVMIFFDIYPSKNYNFYINLFYQYFTPFEAGIHDIPFYSNQKQGYIDTYDSFISYEPFLSYKIIFPAENHFGLGVGYKFLFFKKYFLKFNAGYFFTMKEMHPENVIYFPNTNQWIYFKEQKYEFNNLIRHKNYILNNIERNENIYFFRYHFTLIFGIKI